ncbi:hypothetical protein KQX54_001829 [Cotesia glomerata]|uniref:Uncharacterized protein n=1 Tax=Cotesia glomerata TaxID=32391 RepID=A0AAV7I4I6_COTGL|nr:hypothetical protein KQX54_001829 [Cotesia glomerata]
MLNPAGSASTSSLNGLNSYSGTSIQIKRGRAFKKISREKFQASRGYAKRSSPGAVEIPGQRVCSEQSDVKNKRGNKKERKKDEEDNDIDSVLNNTCQHIIYGGESRGERPQSSQAYLSLKVRFYLFICLFACHVLSIDEESNSEMKEMKEMKEMRKMSEVAMC